jgi:hypothetical protein
LGTPINIPPLITMRLEAYSTKSTSQSHSRICYTSRCDECYCAREIPNVAACAKIHHILGKSTVENTLHKCGCEAS